MPNEPAPIPKPSTGDGVHAWAKAGLSVVPMAGDLFQMIVQPPLEKRRQAWMEGVGERLAALEAETGLKLESLQENEQFISAVLHASAMAIKNHQQEKLDALRNAVINVAKGQSPEDAVLHMYLQFVDDLSVVQVQMLQVFMNPSPPENMSMGGLSHVLEHSMPQLRGKQALYSRLWSDLAARGLVQSNNLNVTMSGSGLRAAQTTQLAADFLKFISP